MVFQVVSWPALTGRPFKDVLSDAVVQELGHSRASERRQLTVVFTDLVNSTALATSLDPEEFHEVLDAYQHRVAEVIASHGGTVTQFQGDGVIAYFGWPLGSDTASQDALSAGLAIVETVSRLADALDVDPLPSLSARVGIHTGVVVVAQATAGGVVRPADIFGDAPTVAARLQSLAPAGQVLISSTTARLVSGWFVLDALGAQTLKGFEFPLEVFRVIAPTGIRSRLDAGRLTSFVGRRAELATLQSHWEATRLGRARAVVVVGDPGIGKSRFVREFVSGFDVGGAPMLITCFERDALSPLQPFQPLVGSVPSGPADAVAWVMDRVRDRPSVLVVEDAHWADPSTLEVVEQLTGVGSRLLVLLTARPEIGARLAGANRLTLDGLTPDDAALVVDGLSVEFPLSADVRSRVVGRAAGVPLFLEELTRSAHEQPEVARPSDEMPVTLGEIVTARLDRLGEAKRTAQYAAVLGAEFDSATLLSVSVENSVSELETSLYLADLVSKGIVQELDKSGEYRFRHALLQEAAYASLLRSDRRKAHGLVADLLAGKQPPDQARPEILAAHLGLAGRAPEAVAQWERAGRHAARRTLFREAAAHLGEALNLLNGLADDEREEAEMRVRLHLGQYQGAIDQAAHGVGDNLRRSAELAAARGDGMALVEANLTLAAHYQAVTDYPAVHRALDVAQKAATDAGVEWFRPAISLLRGPVLVWQGNLREGQEVIEEALKAAGTSIDERPTAARMHMPGLIVSVVTGGYILYALAESLSGRMQDATRFADWAADLASEKASDHAQCMSWTTRAVMHQLEGDAAAVRTFAAQALSVADDRTTAQFRVWARALLDWADGAIPRIPPREEHAALFMRPYLLSLQADRTPDASEAVALLDEALAICRATDERFCEAELLRLRAVRLAQAGDLEEAVASVSEAVTVAQAQGARMLESRAAKTRSQLDGATAVTDPGSAPESAGL